MVLEDLEEPRSLNYQWIEVFLHCSAEVTKMEPTLRSAQVLKQEAEDIGLQGKGIAELESNKLWIGKTGQHGEKQRRCRHRQILSWQRAEQKHTE